MSAPQPLDWQALFGMADQLEFAGGLAMVNSMSEAEALVWYNQHGIAAYPASPTGKKLALPPGYHFHDLGPLSGDDLARHAGQFVQEPGLRVAIVCGKASGLLGMDADDLDQWKRLAEELGIEWDDPGTAWQTTGREGGGLHLLWRRDGIDEALLAKNGRWSAELLNIEIKANHMLMAAPSVHENGVRYQWQTGLSSPARFPGAALLDGRRDTDKRMQVTVRNLVALTTVGDREQVEAANPADFRDTLCSRLGTGSLTGVFQRDNKLIVVPRFGESGYVPVKDSDEHPEKNPPAQVRILTEKMLQGFVASRWWTYVQKGNDKTGFEKVHVLPPLAACGAALPDPSAWTDVPPLAGVTHIPLLRPDGTLLSQPGYDEATSLLYLPLPGQAVPAVPDKPTADQARQARDFLRGIVREFGWVSDADRANYLGAMIMPALRLAVPPPWPPLAINAHERGSGKTYLSELLRLLYEGVMYAAPEGNEDELRKLITTILAGTTGVVVVFDNAMEAVRSRHLASLFTNPDGSWRDRLLGGNESPGLSNDRLWVFNGNNLSMGGDLPRRVLWASIDPGEPQPWLRTDFKIGNLPVWVREHRHQILSCILCLGRYWAQAGMPAGSAARSDSFERYAASASGVLETCGLAEPGQFWSAQTSQAAEDEEDGGWADFLAAVWSVWGGSQWNARGLIAAVQDWNNAGQVIRAALPGGLSSDLSTGRKDAADVARSLGWWCRNHEGQWTSGRLRVKGQGQAKKHAKLWAVEHRPSPTVVSEHVQES